MPTAKSVRHVHIHRHYHYHAAKPAATAVTAAPKPASYWVDAYLAPTDAPDAPPSPPLTPLPPYYRSQPRPEAFWARQRWRAACWIERKWEIVRPWAIWAANIALRIVDFVLTRVTIGFMFRPIGDR